MRKHANHTVRFWAVMALALLLGMTGFSSVSAQDGPVGATIEHGNTLEKGELGVWEVASHPNSEIFAGYPAEDFVAGDNMNAWHNYPDFATALDGACQTANVRLTEHGFTSVTVNGQAFTNLEDCQSFTAFGTAPSGSENNDSSEGGDLDSMTLSGDTTGESQDQPMVANPGVYDAQAMQDLGVECRAAKSAAMSVESSGSSEGSIYDDEAATDLPNVGDATATGLAVPAGECINSGLIVVRTVRYGVGGSEDVRALEVGNGLVVYCGKHGGLAYDCWENYVAPGMAIYAACEQARGDYETIDVEGAFNYRFAAVLYNGGQVPAVCK